MGYWLGVSAFLHFNTILLLIAILPFPNARHWKYFLESTVVRFFINILNIDLWKIYLMMSCLSGMLFLESIRQFTKYSRNDYQLIGNLETRREAHLVLALAERNYFISGATFVLCLLFPRLVTILKENANYAVKMETLEMATSVFREVVHVMEVEKRIDRQGGVGIALLDTMRGELEKLHRDGEGRDTSLQLSDLKEILELYEIRRERERQAQGQQQPGDGLYQQPRRLRTPFSSSEPTGWPGPPPTLRALRLGRDNNNNAY